MTHKLWYLPLYKGGIIPLALLHSYLKPHIHLQRAQGHEDENLQITGRHGQTGNREVNHKD